jgi:TolB-like protein/DNA-binding winged helix-turn-helix (wHTH) protein/Flp pilus assembly protein TadD
MSVRFYEFGPFRVDTLNHVLLRDGETLPLKPKVFDTLLVLIENRGRVLDKDELISRLWPDTVVEEANLTQNIYLLRKALGEDPQGEAYIQTMPRRGYRFAANVCELEAEPPEPTSEENTPSQIVVEDERERATRSAGDVSGSFLSRTTPRRRVVAVAITAVALAAALVYVWTSTRPQPAAAPTITSIAVLPFKPLGSDASDESLGFGMADTLITRLSNIKQLVVRPTSAVRKFTSPEQDPAAAGRELKVDAILEGSIQRAGDRIRVTLRLVRVSDGSSIWAGQFDEQVNDFLAVQDRVSERVAHALVPQITGEEQKLLAKHYTENAEAYQLYMRGRYHWSKINPADWNKAVDYFNRAIEKDPDYALAYTGLADAYVSIVADSLIPKPEAIPKAKQAATTALRLDDTLAEAHVSLGRIKAFYDWDWPGAEGEFKRAIELNPNSADAHREYASYLTTVGRSEQAIAEAKQARELDPLSQLANYHVAWALIAARRYDEAIEQSKQVLGTFPAAHLWLGWAYLGKGRYTEAVSEFEKRLSLSKDEAVTRAHLGYAYAAAGRRGEAEKVLADLNELFRQRQVSPYYIAIVYAGLGGKEQAFGWLEKAYQEHSRPLGGLKVNPVWDNLRSDPRFADLLRRIGLPQ